MFDLRVEVSKEIDRLSRDLKAAGNRKLRQAVNGALTDAAKPVMRAAQVAALEKLPKRGGLNKWLSDAQWKATLAPGKNPRITIRGIKTGHDLRAIDQGYVRHPVFGHKDRKWAVTEITPGVFTDAMRAATDVYVIGALLRAADKTINEWGR